MAPEENGDTADIKQLALDFLNETGEDSDEDDYEEDDEEETEARSASGHPAWKSILDAVPEEYHDALTPTLQEWDTGVSRQFQKLHDKYEPFEALSDYDPDTVKEALNIYTQLVNDPAATWETIGKVFDLSPQETTQSGSFDEEDFDGMELPEALVNKLAQVDEMGEVLQIVTRELNQRREQEEMLEGDAELDEYLAELEEEYGEFDEDYVVALIGAGVDGDEAVERFQALFESDEYESDEDDDDEYEYEAPNSAPKIMSSAGGVPTSVSGLSDLSKLNSQNTKELVTEILRLSAEDN